MRRADLYSYRVRWFSEDNEFVATVAEFPSLSWLASSQQEALDGLRQLVGDVVDDMASNVEFPPVPLGERK